MPFSEIVVDHQESLTDVIHHLLTPFGVGLEVSQQFLIAAQGI
jgi:hypothetical protein